MCVCNPRIISTGGSNLIQSISIKGTRAKLQRRKEGEGKGSKVLLTAPPLCNPLFIAISLLEESVLDALNLSYFFLSPPIYSLRHHGSEMQYSRAKCKMH